MSVHAPHFLLYSEAAAASSCGQAARFTGSGRWRFVLRLPGGETSLEAADEEPEVSSERLELLAVIRGLEALSQPSRVTLVTKNRSIQHGLAFGISQWRDNDWQWERYGRMTAIKNRDLWQRLDRLLAIHSVDCRLSRHEKADDLAPPPRRHRGRLLRMDPAAPRKSKNRRTKEPKACRRNRLVATHGFFDSSVLRFVGSSVLRFFGSWSAVIKQDHRLADATA